jgi:hypothetical protein
MGGGRLLFVFGLFWLSVVFDPLQVLFFADAVIALKPIIESFQLMDVIELGFQDVFSVADWLHGYVSVSPLVEIWNF